MNDYIRYFVSGNVDNTPLNIENYQFINNISTIINRKLSISTSDDFKTNLVFIGGGGTENQFKSSIHNLLDPIIIITSGKSNSLAASMEILSYLKQQNRKGIILHGTEQQIAHKLNLMLKCLDTLHKLNNMNLGQIGQPSDWLISSDVDPARLKEVCGINIVNVTMDEWFEEIAKKSYPENQYTKKLKESNFDKQELEKALEIYGALYRIKEKYHLSGLTIRCFDLLQPIKNTGCLGLAILNAEGIYGGCEGDMPSLISMAILGELTKEPVFMCNPSRIINEDNDIIFAHCTLPLNMPKTYQLMTHYESGLGVAIRGQIPEQEATIFKCNKDLSRYYVNEGTIKENLYEKYLCRTQIKFHFNNNIDYFTTNPIGNHHLVCLGNHKELIDEFFNLIK